MHKRAILQIRKKKFCGSKLIYFVIRQNITNIAVFAICVENVRTQLQWPYDFYCPAVREILMDRVCKICGLYFGIKKNIHAHKKGLYNLTSSPTEKVQAMSNLQCKEGSSFCVFKDSIDDAEWSNDDDDDDE